jgi:large subunit ribosomal protein L21
MFAIVETSGRQFKIEPGATITVDRMDVEVGSTITLDRVLLISDGKLKVGQPTIDGAKVTAKVLDHPKGDKVIAFRYRRRHRTRRRVGFRASLTTLEILGIEA